MIKLKMIVGSTRPNRAADKVLPWIVKRSMEHGEFDTEVLDLRDWQLPQFQEHMGTIGDPADPTYSMPVVREWNQKMREAQALLIVTPEYLHGMPGTLKNALDNVFASFALRNKPVGVAAYSTGIAGGSRAVENLAHVAVEAELILMRNTVLIPFVDSAFNSDGEPANPITEVAARIMLDDLAWWSKILNEAREKGQLPPGSARMRKMLAEMTATR